MTRWKKQYYTFLILVLTATMLSCAAKRLNVTTPQCISDFIAKYKNNPDWHVGSVDEFEFQGKLVYAFNPSKNWADDSTSIKSASCVTICSIGGFAGPKNNQCNGDNFFENAIFKRAVWKRE